MDITEIEIPVPWGHIAAKVWGDMTDTYVLVFHGLMDNAGSFDRLIPHLPRSFCYLCFDLPGHGKSSHFPPFLPLFAIDYVISYKFIMQHLKKDRYIMLAHSYGGYVALLFAQIYPEHVDRLILMDTIHRMPIPPNKLAFILRTKIDESTSLNNRSVRPTYTYEEALQRLQASRLQGVITAEAAERLLPRALTSDGNGRYTFSSDRRLRNFTRPLLEFPNTFDTVMKLPISRPVLCLVSQHTMDGIVDVRLFIKLLEYHKNVTIKVLNGQHDMHNNSPEIVAPDISRFLLVEQAKL